MRRRAPRPLGAALADLRERQAPQTLLARVQGVWPGVAGDVLAREATPSAERAGTVRMACRAATWAHELELLEPDLRERLNAALGGSGDGPVTALRFGYERSREGGDSAIP